jgi:hypothetical protein
VGSILTISLHDGARVGRLRRTISGLRKIFAPLAWLSHAETRRTSKHPTEIKRAKLCPTLILS